VPLNDDLGVIFIHLSESHKPGVETRCLAIDFTGGIDIYDEIKKKLEGLDIAILGALQFSFRSPFQYAYYFIRYSTYVLYIVCIYDVVWL
jgi:hypothetical protein